MWMECQCKLRHLDRMTLNADQSVGLNTPLGQRAEGRAPVDLLVEAVRLNFSAEEIAELRRLYAIDTLPDQAKTPQKAI
jgi:hypothetical protein